VLSSDLARLGLSAYDNPPPVDTLFANAGGMLTVSPTNPALQPSGFVQRDGAVVRLVPDRGGSQRGASAGQGIQCRALSLAISPERINQGEHRADLRELPIHVWDL